LVLIGLGLVVSGLGLGLGLAFFGLGLGLGLALCGLVNITVSCVLICLVGLTL